MLWNLVKGVVVLACEVAGVGVIPAALTVVGVLTTTSTILRADDPQTEVRNALTDWVIDKVADRVVTAMIGAIGLTQACKTPARLITGRSDREDTDNSRRRSQDSRAGLSVADIALFAAVNGV